MAGARCLFLVASLTLTAAAAADQTEDKDRLLPFFDDWFVEQGIDLLRPLGVGIAAIYMNRGVEVDDVRVSFGDRPPQSISDRTDFNVNNSTSLITARADAWVLICTLD